MFKQLEERKKSIQGLSEVDYLIRFIVVILSIAVFYLTKKNLVYPTLFSAMMLTLFSSYL